MAAPALNHTRTATAAPAYTGTRSGLEYRLGQQVGAGGNGIVYTVARRPELVAKIQKYALDRHDVLKLEVLAQAATPDLLAVAAWPTDLLRDDMGLVVGFVMPRVVEALPLYELYSPRSRVQKFPSADFRFLVHVAANVARLFAAVHKAGFICGDVNHSNILVRQTGTVAAVDCDSFQVGDGSRFPCLVGTELFVPPELIGVNLGKTRRTTNHDNFGLAVLIFNLLFMGRHPFAGRYTGSGEMPIETATAECRFAYSREPNRTRMMPPPYTPPMGAVGPAVADLFERAFHPDARTGKRPSPETWIDALDALKTALVPCKSVSWHYHARDLLTCPWCEIEQTTRIKLFGGLVRVATSAVADLDSLWARYLSMIEPAAARVPPLLPKRKSIWTRLRIPWAQAIRPTLKSRIATIPGRLREIASRVRWDTLIPIGGLMIVAGVQFEGAFRAIAALLSVLIRVIISEIEVLASKHNNTALCVAMVIMVGPMLEPLLRRIGQAVVRALLRPSATSAAAPPTSPAPRLAPLRSGYRLAKRKWQSATAAWAALPAPPDVTDLKMPIEEAKRLLDLLAEEREAAIRACAAPETEEAQLARYLGAHRIEDARLPNIGPARCSVLRSWGIDTAADIDETKIAEIPGFGKGLTDKLIAWRDSVQASFTINTTAVVDPLEVQRIDRKLAARRTKCMKELRSRIGDLEARLAGYLKEREDRWRAVEDAYREVLRSGA